MTPKGIRVQRFSPGWIETEATVALAERLAVEAGTDYQGGKRIITQSPGLPWSVWCLTPLDNAAFA